MSNLLSNQIAKIGLVIVFMMTSISVQLNAQNKTDDQGRKQGVWEKKKSDGRLHYRGQFKDDIPYGKFKYYDKTGFIKTLLEYQTPDSVIATHYHGNGKKSAYGYYVNQKKEGVWRFYDRKGVKSSEQIYVNGLKNGKQTIYNLNGSVSRVTFYKNDVENGYRKTFNTDGELLSEGEIRDGHMDGMQKIYRAGKINIEGAYKHSVRDGEWKYYDEKGELYKTEVYELGIKKN